MFVTKKRFKETINAYEDAILEYDTKLSIARDILAELHTNIEHIKNVRLKKLLEEYFND